MVPHFLAFNSLGSDHEARVRLGRFKMMTGVFKEKKKECHRGPGLQLSL